MSDMDLIGTGRDALVYALDGTRALRRHHDGRDVAGEANIMRHVAVHGFPVPQVFDSNGPDLVMQRVDGRQLVETVIDSEMDPGAAGEMLALLQRRLHAVPPRIAANRGDRILHLDLHPGNVLVTSVGPVVIDWTNAAEGMPSLDVALSALIIAEAALGSFVSAELGPVVRQMLTGFLGASHADPTAHVDHVCELRRAYPNLTVDEIARLDDAGTLVAETWRLVVGRTG